MKHPQNDQRRCIFCDGTPLSREHVFAEWVHPYLPDPKDMGRAMRAHKLSLSQVSNGTITPGASSDGKFNRPGGPKSKRLRVVCGPCNNGWMSVVQTSAKPVLLPLITGTWVALTPAAQRTLAAWMTMFTMVAERSCEDVETSTFAQRQLFKEQGKDREPPTNSLIWIFSHDDDENPLGFWIRTVGVDEATPHGVAAYYGASITGVALNKFGAIVISAADSNVLSTVKLDLKILAARVELRQLWPMNTLRGPPKRPAKALKLSTARDFFDEIGKILMRGIKKQRTRAK